MQNLRLAACCLNISEGCNISALENIAAAAVKSPLKYQEDIFPTADEISYEIKTTVISLYSDAIFKRGNITISGFVPYLSSSIYQACREAFRTISSSSHVNVGHPRLGTIDLIPIHPISPSVSLETCGKIARRVGANISSFHKDIDIHYYGAASNENINLVDLRKNLNWFSNTGEKSISFEQTVIGASPYMTVINVALNTNNLAIGKNIAKSVRERSVGGLKGIQAMAFRKSDDVIEIACNIDTNDLQSKHPTFPTSFNDLEQRIISLANKNCIEVIGESLRGFHPHEAYKITQQALQNGNIYAWKDHLQNMM